MPGSGMRRRPRLDRQQLDAVRVAEDRAAGLGLPHVIDAPARGRRARVFCSQSHACGLSTSPAQTTRSSRRVIDAAERVFAVAHQHAHRGRRREDAGDAELLDARSASCASGAGWSSAPSNATVVQPAMSGA